MKIEGLIPGYRDWKLIIDGKYIPLKDLIKPNKHGIDIGSVYLKKEIGKNFGDIVNHTPVLVLRQDDDMFLCLVLHNHALEYCSPQLLQRPSAYSDEDGYIW